MTSTVNNFLKVAYFINYLYTVVVSKDVDSNFTHITVEIKSRI
jgi:hypothetical protein